MTGLPRIVRSRLRQAPGGTGAVDHPNANLLAGFAEHSLTSRERSLVLHHLAQCAECREQVSLALPKLDAEVVPAGVAAARCWPGWLRWPVLRWGLLVASLVIMGGVALLRQPPARRMELTSRAHMAPRPATPLPSDVVIGAAPSKAANPAGQPSQETADESALSLRQMKKALKEKQAGEAQFAMRALEVAQPSQAPMAARVPAEAFPPSPKAINSGGSKQPSSAIVAQAPPPAPPPVQGAAPAQGQPAQQAPDSLLGAEAKSAEASSTSEQNKGKTLGGPVGGALGGVVPAAPAETASRETVHHLISGPKASRAMGAKTESGAAPAAISAGGPSANFSTRTPADWSISASGRVLRSLDGRKTWEELDVDKNVVFRAIFAAGPDVWLGGTKGALYHSTDGGQHWTRVNITTGSTTVTDDVVRIEFKDAQHGTVKTAARDTWTTLDAGQHWQKQ